MGKRKSEKEKLKSMFSRRSPFDLNFGFFEEPKKKKKKKLL